MKSSFLFIFILFTLSLFAQTDSTQVLVIGGGTSGVCAGIQAARMKAETIIVEPTLWLGGMLTSAGVSATDGNDELPSGLWGEFRDSIRHYYGGADKVSTGWVSNTLFEPHVGAGIFRNMAHRESNLRVFFETSFVSMTHKTGGNRGWLVKVRNKWGTETLIDAAIVIDATELGDVAAAAGVRYHIGTDDPDETEEWGYAVRKTNIVQDLTYAAILKDFGEGFDKTIEKPAHYDPNEFACACKNPLCHTDDPDRPSGVTDCDKMLSYARLPNNKVLLNWPGRFGNDFYANLIEADDATRQRTIDSAKQKTLRFIYFIQHELGYKHLGIADDEFPTADGLPFYPYFRESRRIEGVATLYVNNILHPYENSLYWTGIAVGDYPVDHHHGQNQAAPKIRFPKVPSFSIPLGALIPKGVEDLIVAEKSISVTNIVNGASRLQPCVMLIGQGAGAWGAIASKRNYNWNRYVYFDYTPDSAYLRDVQNVLLDAGCYLMPYVDVKPSDPHFKSIQRIGATGILRGVGEPHGWENRTWFYPDSVVQIADLKVGLKDYLPPNKAIRSNIDIRFLDSASILTIGLALKLYEAWKKSSFHNLYNTTLDTIAGSEPAIRWWAIHLKNFDETRPITRREFAVWLDRSVNPFMKNGIGLDGRIIHHFEGGIVHDPFTVESTVDTGEFIQNISVSQYGGVDKDSSHVLFDSLYSGSGSRKLGIYPIHPFSGLYQVGSPSISNALLFLPNGNRLVVHAKNLSPTNRYVQSVYFNDVPFNDVFLKHEVLMKGGKLEFVMGELPNGTWFRE